MPTIILNVLGENIYIHTHTHTHTHIYIYIYMTSSILAAHCVSTVVAFRIQRVKDHSLDFV